VLGLVATSGCGRGRGRRGRKAFRGGLCGGTSGRRVGCGMRVGRSGSFEGASMGRWGSVLGRRTSRRGQRRERGRCGGDFDG